MRLDVEAVFAYIRGRFPDLQVKMAGIYDRVKFGGAEFTYGNEWDDPCLISNSASGDKLLEQIFKDVSPGQ